MKIFYFSNKLSIFSKYFEVSDVIEPRTAMNSLIYWTDIHKAHQRRGIRVSETFAESWSSGGARPDRREWSVCHWQGLSAQLTGVKMNLRFPSPARFRLCRKQKWPSWKAESFLSAQSLQIIEPLLMTYIRFLNLWNGIKNGIDK